MNNEIFHALMMFLNYLCYIPVFDTLILLDRGYFGVS